MNEIGSTQNSEEKTRAKLEFDALKLWEVLAHAVALISPSMAAALIVPVMLGTAGTSRWLRSLFGTILPRRAFESCNSS